MTREKEILKGQIFNASVQHAAQTEGFKELSPEKKAKVILQYAKAYLDEAERQKYLEW